MNKENPFPIKNTERSYRVRRPTQTGFSSPATHYSEPRIDLNEVLAPNSSATFYVRVVDDAFNNFDISINDVLIIDRSLAPRSGQLVFAIHEDSFDIFRIDKRPTGELEVWGVITYIIKSVL